MAIKITTKNNSKILKIHPKKINIKFEQAVDSINKDVIDINMPSTFFSNKEFIGILGYSDDFFKDALSYLTDTLKIEQKKIIVMYTMQNLNYKKYLLFLNSSIELYEHNIISEEVIRSFIIPCNDWDNELLRNFYKIEIRKALNRIKRNNKTSMQFKTIINKIIWGRIWWNRL